MGASDVSLYPQPDVLIPNAIFTAGSALDVPMVIQGYVGQTADLVNIIDSAGNLLLEVDSRGTVRESRPSYYRQFLFGGNA